MVSQNCQPFSDSVISALSINFSSRGLLLFVGKIDQAQRIARMSSAVAQGSMCVLINLSHWMMEKIKCKQYA